MKRTIIFCLAIILFAACNKESAINFLTADLVIDAGARTMTLPTDLTITNIFVKSWTEKGMKSIGNVISNDGMTFSCDGDWFLATVNRNDAKHATLSLSANDTGYDRRLEITVKHYCFVPATIEIIQKAQ